jgi:hypothetical protein
VFFVVTVILKKLQFICHFEGTRRATEKSERFTGRFFVALRMKGGGAYRYGQNYREVEFFATLANVIYLYRFRLVLPLSRFAAVSRADDGMDGT